MSAMNGSQDEVVKEVSELDTPNQQIATDQLPMQDKDAQQDIDKDEQAIDHAICEQLRIDTEKIPVYIEAMLMATDKPMPIGKLSDALTGVNNNAVEQAIHSLNQLYTETERSFRIEKLAGGYQILTLPAYEDFVAQMNKTRSSNRLRAPAMETLSIVAYKQPILRAELEAIRGVACGEVLRSLMERHLVKIVGRADEIGRPMLYGTTRQFLEVFGLSNLNDLPRAEELRPKKQRAIIEEAPEEKAENKADEKQEAAADLTQVENEEVVAVTTTDGQDQNENQEQSIESKAIDENDPEMLTNENGA